MRTGTLFLFALVSIPRAAWPQGEPLGPEFRVTTFGGSPSVAADAAGNFVVVWGGPGDIIGQRYASSGVPLGPEFRVNTYTSGGPFDPSVAADSAGNFVVAWQNYGQDGSYGGVFGQRYASSGAPLGPEFRVNTHTTNSQRNLSVAADAAGNFVVVWDSNNQVAPGYSGVFGQRYASSGTPIGPEFRVNTYTSGGPAYPSVAADPLSGNFVVVWSSWQDGSTVGIVGQRYASSGTPLGPEFPVNTFTTNAQHFPSVAADIVGNFVVVWRSQLQDGSDDGVFGQRYASSGAPVGPEFRVNTYTTGGQDGQFVAADSAGNFVVVWQSRLQDGSGSGVFGQRYASSGAPDGPEFRVNTHTTDYQIGPSVAAADSSGSFVVVWYSFEAQYPFPVNLGVFGQRYGRIVPVELMRLTVE